MDTLVTFVQRGGGGGLTLTFKIDIIAFSMCVYLRLNSSTPLNVPS